MKIFAFAASNSRASINRSLLEHAATRLQQEIAPDAEITFADLNDYEMPIYSIDRENADGIPAAAQDFLEKIGAADALLISFAEHNGSITTAWKNIFDWMSRIDTKIFQNKPMVILSAAPGPRAGAGVLGGQEAAIPRFGGKIVGKLGIGSWGEAWNAAEQRLTRAEDAEALDQVLSALSPVMADR